MTSLKPIGFVALAYATFKAVGVGSQLFRLYVSENPKTLLEHMEDILGKVRIGLSDLKKKKNDRQVEEGVMSGKTSTMIASLKELTTEYNS